MSYAEIGEIITNILCVSSEKCILFYDHYFSNVRQLIDSACRDNSIPFQGILIEYNGASDPPDVVRGVLTNAEDKVILFALKNAGIWHIPERKTAKYQLKKRLLNFVCSPTCLINPRHEQTLLDFSALGQSVQAILGKGKEVTITTPVGTNLHACISSKSRPGEKYYPFLEVGAYCSPGSGGDFPFGEAGFGPEINSVNGDIVFDYKIQHVGFLKEPITIKLVEDRVVTIDGQGNSLDLYNRLLEQHSAFQFLCEIGIGLNPYVVPDNDSNFIPEEKLFSTIHFGFGGNLSYGDRIGPHFDAIIKRPTMSVDGTIVMRDGQFSDGLFSSIASLTKLNQHVIL